MQFADLHLHSTYSDGRLTPEQIVEQAAAAGLKAISLTDHDTMAGVKEAEQAAAQHSLAFLSGGIELSCLCQKMEVHLLGYRLDPENDYLLQKLARFRKSRKDRFLQMAESISGFAESAKDEIAKKMIASQSPGRLHLAELLVQYGKAESIQNAFDKYLAEGASAWRPKFSISLKEAIKLIKQAGGIAIIAHPGIYRDSNLVLKEALKNKIEGIEVYHPYHNYRHEIDLLQFTKDNNLLIFGGSDSHFINDSKRKRLIGQRGIDQQMYQNILQHLKQ